MFYIAGFTKEPETLVIRGNPVSRCNKLSSVLLGHPRKIFRSSSVKPYGVSRHGDTRGRQGDPVRAL